MSALKWGDDADRFGDEAELWQELRLKATRFSRQTLRTHNNNIDVEDVAMEGLKSFFSALQRGVITLSYDYNTQSYCVTKQSGIVCSLDGYLRKIIINARNNLLSIDKPGSNRPYVLHTVDPDFNSTLLLDQVFATEDGMPYEEMVRKEELQEQRTLLHDLKRFSECNLSPQQREVFTRFCELALLSDSNRYGLEKAIAQDLNMSHTQVRVIMCRIRKKLRRLGPKWPPESA